MRHSVVYLMITAQRNGGYDDAIYDVIEDNMIDILKEYSITYPMIYHGDDVNACPNAGIVCETGTTTRTLYAFEVPTDRESIISGIAWRLYYALKNGHAVQASITYTTHRE